MQKGSEKIREKIMRLCSVREMCSNDIYEKLTRWDVPAEDQEEILDFLVKHKFVDDQRFTFAYVRQQHTLRKWGKQKIRHHLMQKNIPESLIRAGLDQISPEDYKNTLVSELLKKRKTIKAKNKFDLMNRLKRFALSRGYEPEVIHQALEDVV